MTAVVGKDSFCYSRPGLTVNPTRRHSAPDGETTPAIRNNKPSVSPVLSYQEKAKRPALSGCRVPSPQADLKNEIRTTTSGMASLMTPIAPIATTIPTSIESAVAESKSHKLYSPTAIDDIIRHHTNLEHPPSDLCRKLLLKLIQVNPNTYCMHFEDVDRVSFNIVSHIIEETDVFFTTRKPRLTYTSLGRSSSSKGIVIVEWPTAMHEVPFEEMSKAFTVAFYTLPYDQDVIRTTVHMNLSLKSDFMSATPDMSISFTTMEGPSRAALVPFIGECAFSQDEGKLIQKLKSEVAAHPEVVLVVAVIIREESPYRSPAPYSPTWETLCKGPPSSFNDFMADIEGSKERTLSRPIVVAGHTWCKVASVEYRVWVRRDKDEPIDVEKHDAEHMVTGSLFPEMNMDAVQASMDKGMQQMKECLIEISHDVSSASEELEKADPTFSIYWTRCIKAFLPAAELTAHQRYLTWFQTNFRGTKRPFEDTDYVEDADADCGNSATVDGDDEGDDDTRPVSAHTRSNNLLITPTTLLPPPIGSQSSKRRNVRGF